VLAGYYHLMNAAERTSNKGYGTQPMRDADAITRALQRTVLSQYENCPPSQWVFSREDSGKPMITSPRTSVCFNLSHTQEWVACAVAQSSLVGVDVENCRREVPVLTLARRFFSKQEYLDLTSLPEEDQKSRFFDCWTLKESYIKARGEGIALGLSKFSFDFGADGAIGFCCNSELQDDPEQWRFMLSPDQGDHRMALAIKRPQFGGEMTARYFLTIPQHSIENYVGPLRLQPHRELR
jgi:4'-phosphopantetheinyl transferase